MAGPLTAVERFFERLFERPAARLFQARVETVQIQRSLERAMEAERRIHARRTYAPSSFRVLLSPEDYQALAGTRYGVVQTQVAEALRVYARSHGYTLLSRPDVVIEASPLVAQGDLRVTAAPPVVPGTVDAGSSVGPDGFLAAAPVGSYAAGMDGALADLSQATAVFAAPSATFPRAVLAIRSPDQPITRVEVRPGTLRLGRSLDNDVVLVDARASRHHGQITARMGMLVYTDLGSTNGSLLNNAPVTEIALGPGDVLQLGSSTITIEPGS